MSEYDTAAQIPMRWVGPIAFVGTELNGEISVPMATFETPLWPTTNRGALVSRLAGGIKTTLVKECMTRAVLLEAPDAAAAQQALSYLAQARTQMDKIIAKTSRFAQLQDYQPQLVGNLIYLRFSFTTGDASGHNMATKAADALANWLCAQQPQLMYVAVSSNFCTDKKVSAVNTLLGRGKHVIAELTIPRQVCEKTLRTTPEKLVNLNIKKNLIGTAIAGGLHSANSHFANILLATYLATGQDAANIIEGSQGIVQMEVNTSSDLYFSVTLPNLIVGTVGNGKHHAFVRDNLTKLGCQTQSEPGENARRLARIIAGAVLCGELSTLAALTNPGELMRSHLLIERRQRSSGETHHA